MLRSFYSFYLLIKHQFHRFLTHLYREITGSNFPYSVLITPNIYLGGQYRQRGLCNFKKWGISAVVSMRAAVPKKYKQADFLDILHLPTPDRHAPSKADLLKGIEFTTKHVKQGDKVYIHCRWGEGRGPTMVAAYLISTGMTLEDALTLIRESRPFIYPTVSQLERLKEIEHHFKLPANSKTSIVT